MGENEKLKSKKRICWEVSAGGIRGVSPEEEKEGYGGKDLQKRKVLSMEWKSDGWWEWWVDGTDGKSMEPFY